MIKFRHSCRGEHILLPVAAKVCKNAFAAESRRFAKTKSINQRNVSFLLHALRRQLGGFLLSPSKCKRCTAYHIFSLADVCGCRGVGFMLFFGFCSLLFSLHITLSQELIFIFSCHLVCDLSTASRCVSRETFQFFSLNPLSFTVVVI